MIPGAVRADHPWCLPAFQALDLSPALFPPLVASTSPAGAITAEAATATGLRPGTTVICGGSDQAMAAIGAGLLAPGTLLVSISTGGQLVTPLDAPLPDPSGRGLRTVCHALPRTYLALAGTLGAGLSLRAARGGIRRPRVGGRCPADGPGRPGARRRERAALPPLPGRRTSAAAYLSTSGAFVGLRLDHGRPHLARAVLEGIAFSLRHAMEPLQQAGVQTTTIVLAGGLALSPLMRRIVADVLARPVAPLETAEQSALGAALIAAHQAGFFPTLQAACEAVVRYGDPVLPTPEHTGALRAVVCTVS